MSITESQGVRVFQRKIVPRLVVILLLLIGELFGMPKQQRSNPSARLGRSEDRPDLAVSYMNAAKFKLASRKTTYRLGEMISLDMALLNTTNSPVYFDRLLQPNFLVRDRKGQAVDLVPYAIAELAPTPDLFVLTEAGEILTKSIQVLVGCNRKSAEDMDPQLESKRVFERNGFVNWGDACLRVNRPGSYTIIVEQGNQRVVVSAAEPGAKTAVGVISSTPLTITIIK